MALFPRRGYRAGILAVAVAVAACHLPPYAGHSPSSPALGGAVKPLALTASARGLSGVATLVSAPFSSAAVQVRRIDDDRLLGTATTRADGAFEATLDPVPEPGTPLRVSAVRDGRTLAALAFAGHQQTQGYRVMQAAAGAFVALNPASTLALAAFLKRIKALSAKLTVPTTKAIALNALPFLLEAYEKAKVAATETLVQLAASSGGGPGGGGRPDLGSLSPTAAKVLERFLEQLLTAVKPEGEINLPPEIVTAIAAPDSPLRQAAEAVLTLLNEAAEVAAVEAQQSPLPSLAPDAWIEALPPASDVLGSPSPGASGALPLEGASSTLPSLEPSPVPSPSASAETGGGRRAAAAVVPAAGFLVDLTGPVLDLARSAVAVMLPSGAKPARLAFRGGGTATMAYIDTNAAATPTFSPSPASYSAYPPMDRPGIGIARDASGDSLASSAVHRIIRNPGSHFFLADANQISSVTVSSPVLSTPVLGGLDNVTDMAADSTYLYVAEGGTGFHAGRVRRFELTDFTASQTLFSGLHWPGAIALDGTHLYVAELGTGDDGTIRRVNLTSPYSRQVIVSGQRYPLSLALPPSTAAASDTLFFTTYEAGETSLRGCTKGGEKFGAYRDLGSTVWPPMVADASYLYVLTSPRDTRGSWGTSVPSPGVPGVSLLRFPLMGGAPERVTRFASDSRALGLHLDGSLLYLSLPDSGVQYVSP